jgi:DNA-binding transcriptional regulator YhcF (GntR family)
MTGATIQTKQGINSSICQKQRRVTSNATLADSSQDCKPLLATGELRLPPSGLLSRPREADMLAYVPVHFPVYRPLKQRLRWTMQCLLAYADHAGRCWPSVRTLALFAGISKSAAARDLAELAALGHLSRKRKPGGVYVYQIAKRFLPQWSREQVSQHRDRQREARRARQAERAERGVPQPGTEEKPVKKNQGYARARESFAGLIDGLPRATNWTPRVKGWKERRFWLPGWGPRPGEAGCWVPAEILAAL